MKRKLFQFLAFVMATVALLSAFVIAPSAKNGKTPLRTEEQAREYIEYYAKDIDEKDRKYSVEETVRLESFTGEKSYLLYTLSPAGYAVYDEISGVVEEMMLGTESPYKDAGVGTPYYGGPMNHILKTEDAYVLISEDHKLTEEDIEEVTKLEQHTVANRQNTVKGIPESTEYYYMDSGSYFSSCMGNFFGDNQNGTCTQVACTVMLGFYDWYVNDLFVPNAYEAQNGNYHGTNEYLHSYLQTFMGSGACGLADATTGLNSYFSAIFFPTPTAYCDIGNHNTVYTRTMNRIYNNRPTVIAMFEAYHPDCYMNHSVVAYGIREELYGMMMTSAAYFVHNGWQSDPLGVYAWDWFADDLYIA